MRHFNRLILGLVCSIFLFMNAAMAQEKKSDLTVVFPNAASVFTDNSNEYQLEFFLKGLDPFASTKPFTEYAQSLQNVSKFSIKNVADNEGRRACYLFLKKDDPMLAFSRIINFMKVSKIMVGEETMDLPAFVTKYKIKK